MFNNWQAAYRLRPFGDEQELLARIVSLLILLASKQMDIATVMEASNAIIRSLMTSEWIGAIDESTTKKQWKESIASFEEVVARAFS